MIVPEVLKRQFFNKVFTGCLVCVSLFWLFFSGDASFFGLKIFFFSLIIFALLFNTDCLCKVKFGYYNLIVFLIFFMLIYVLIYKLSHFDLGYYIWPFQVVVSFCMLSYVYVLLEKQFNNSSLYVGLYYSSIMLILFFTFGSLLFSESGRSDFIFGPNIHYRLSSFLYVLLLFTLVKLDKGRLAFLFVTLIFAIYVLSTGSRAALVVMPIMLLALAHAINGKLSIKALYIALLLVFFLVVLGITFDISLAERLLNFDFENNNSLYLRLRPWYSFFNDLTGYIFSFGISYNDFYSDFGDPQFPYPHNIFLELIFFFGIFGGVISFFIIKEVVVSFIKLFSLDFSDFEVPIVYFLLIFLVGASFSGDLTDNFTLISLALLTASLRARII
jgi:hypothetical protein